MGKKRLTAIIPEQPEKAEPSVPSEPSAPSVIKKPIRKRTRSRKYRLAKTKIDSTLRPAWVRLRWALSWPSKREIEACWANLTASAGGEGLAESILVLARGYFRL